MFVVISAMLLACFVITYTVLTKKNNEQHETNNKELIKYFEEFYYANTHQKKQQLLRAAKYLIEMSEFYRLKDASAESLYKEGILSDEYMINLNQIMEEYIFVEKCLIQREAEELKAGYGETIFSEANHLNPIFRPENNYKPLIDYNKFILSHEKLKAASK